MDGQIVSKKTEKIDLCFYNYYIFCYDNGQECNNSIGEKEEDRVWESNGKHGVAEKDG